MDIVNTEIIVPLQLCRFLELGSKAGATQRGTHQVLEAAARAALANPAEFAQKDIYFLPTAQSNDRRIHIHLTSQETDTLQRMAAMLRISLRELICSAAAQYAGRELVSCGYKKICLSQEAINCLPLAVQGNNPELVYSTMSKQLPKALVEVACRQWGVTNKAAVVSSLVRQALKKPDTLFDAGHYSIPKVPSRETRDIPQTAQAGNAPVVPFAATACFLTKNEKENLTKAAQALGVSETEFICHALIKGCSPEQIATLGFKKYEAPQTPEYLKTERFSIPSYAALKEAIRRKSRFARNDNMAKIMQDDVSVALHSTKKKTAPPLRIFEMPEAMSSGKVPLTLTQEESDQLRALASSYNVKPYNVAISLVAAHEGIDLATLFGAENPLQPVLSVNERAAEIAHHALSPAPVAKVTPPLHALDPSDPTFMELMRQRGKQLRQRRLEEQKTSEISI